MAQEQLRDADVASRFRHVVGEGVTKQMGVDSVSDAGALTDLGDQTAQRLHRGRMLPLVRLLAVSPGVTPPLRAEHVVVVLEPLNLVYDRLQLTEDRDPALPAPLGDVRGEMNEVRPAEVAPLEAEQFAPPGLAGLTHRHAGYDHGVSTSEKSVTTGGSLLMNISNEIVQAKKRFFGKGPTKARSYFLDDMLLVVLRGGLTVAEHTMVGAGKERSVVDFRQDFQAETSAELTRAIEQLTGRTVINHQSQVMFDPDVAIEIFVFADMLPHDIAEGAIEITPGLIDALTAGDQPGKSQSV